MDDLTEILLQHIRKKPLLLKVFLSFYIRTNTTDLRNRSGVKEIYKYLQELLDLQLVVCLTPNVKYKKGYELSCRGKPLYRILKDEELERRNNNGM